MPLSYSPAPPHRLTARDPSGEAVGLPFASSEDWLCRRCRCRVPRLHRSPANASTAHPPNYTPTTNLPTHTHTHTHTLQDTTRSQIQRGHRYNAAVEIQRGSPTVTKNTVETSEEQHAEEEPQGEPAPPIPNTHTHTLTHGRNSTRQICTRCTLNTHART